MKRVYLLTSVVLTLVAFVNLTGCKKTNRSSTVATKPKCEIIRLPLRVNGPCCYLKMDGFETIVTANCEEFVRAYKALPGIRDKHIDKAWYERVCSLENSEEALVNLKDCTLARWDAPFKAAFVNLLRNGKASIKRPDSTFVRHIILEDTYGYGGPLAAHIGVRFVTPDGETVFSHTRLMS